jgi:hypothetical protein
MPDAGSQAASVSAAKRPKAQAEPRGPRTRHAALRAPLRFRFAARAALPTCGDDARCLIAKHRTIVMFWGAATVHFRESKAAEMRRTSCAVVGRLISL